MKIKILLLVLAAILLVQVPFLGGCDYVTGNLPENEQQVDVIRDIVPLLLAGQYDDGRYNIINPEFNIEGLTTDRSKDDFIERLVHRGYDISQLWDELFKANEEPIPMNLASSIEDGYQIDYDHQFDAYFEKYGFDGWKKFREENPKARAHVSISLPVYDEKTHLVLVYISWVGDWLLGGGNIVVFKYRDGSLTLVDYMDIWIS